MKRKYQSLSLVVLLAFVALSITACPPPFFGGSSFHDNITETAMNMPDGLNLFQKIIAPGYLSLSAVNDAVGGDTVTIRIYGDMGLGQTGRRLSMWDHQTQQYVSIEGNETWANNKIKDQIEFRPYVNLNTVDIHWDTNTLGTYTPVLVIQISDAMTTTEYTTGQIWQIRIKHLDEDELKEDSEVNCFKTDIYTLGMDRLYYLREGSGDIVRPEFVSFNIDDNEVVDGDTAIPINHDFQLVINDIEGLGDLWIALIDQGDSVSDSNDNKYIPLPTRDVTKDGSDNFTYTLGLPKQLEYSTTYYLVIGQASGPTESLPYIGALMPFTQDLSGNSIKDTSNLLTREDISDVLGGDPAGINILTRSFTTVAPPP